VTCERGSSLMSTSLRTITTGSFHQNRSRLTDSSRFPTEPADSNVQNMTLPQSLHSSLFFAVTACPPKLSIEQWRMVDVAQEQQQ